VTGFSPEVSGLHADGAFGKLNPADAHAWTKHPCLDSAAAILAFVPIPSIKEHPLKIPKGECNERATVFHLRGGMQPFHNAGVWRLLSSEQKIMVL